MMESVTWSSKAFVCNDGARGIFAILRGLLRSQLSYIILDFFMLALESRVIGAAALCHITRFRQFAVNGWI